MISNNLLAPLDTFAKNVYSQFGEDGITEEILQRICKSSDTDSWCVEFGAWDGEFLSNTCNLIRNKKYKAVLIEGDPDRHKELCKNIPQENVHKICEFVTFEGESTLDKILQKTPIPRDFDFLSIDIDGCDYFIFDSLAQFTPKVICIEYNPTIPNEVDFIQPKDFKIKQGSSSKSLQSLATSKGYTLVAVTACNLYFVKNELAFYVIGANTPTLESLRDDGKHKMFIFVGYDGTILSNKESLRLPWHDFTRPTTSFQQLPSILRTFISDYSYPQKVLFTLWLALKDRKGFKNLKRFF